MVVLVDWPQPVQCVVPGPLVANQCVYLVITPIWTKMSPTTDLLNDPLADNFRGPGQWVWPLQQNSVSCSITAGTVLNPSFPDVRKTVFPSIEASSYGDDVDTTAQLYNYTSIQNRNWVQLMCLVTRDPRGPLCTNFTALRDWRGWHSGGQEVCSFQERLDECAHGWSGWYRPLSIFWILLWST